MKPFVAIAVLVAASLTATSAAPAQQQVAQGSGVSAVGQRPLTSGGFHTPGFQSQFGFGSLPSYGGQFGAWSSGGSPFGPVGGAVGAFPGSGVQAPSSGSPGSSVAGGVGRPSSAAGGANPFVSNLNGGYPGFVGVGSYNPGYYYASQGYGPSVYGQNYGNGGGAWGYAPFWGYDNGFGYSGGYGSAFPGQVSYGGLGGLGFGGVSGQSAIQLPAGLAGSRRSGPSVSSSSSQRSARRE